jgi:hypothetical protein
MYWVLLEAFPLKTVWVQKPKGKQTALPQERSQQKGQSLQQKVSVWEDFLLRVERTSLVHQPSPLL